MPTERAVIDIGSNTVRLVIYDGPKRAPEIVLNEKVTARLGRSVGETGLLSEDAMALALAAARRFALLVSLRGIREVYTVATAAARDATNGRAFLDAVSATGLEPRLLSGEEEALTSALGVAGAFPGCKGVVADLGGGSLELIHVDGFEREPGVSLPLGSLMLPQLRVGGSVKFGRKVHKLVQAARWTCAPGETLYLVGGSFRAFARYSMDRSCWPLDDPHGFAVGAAAALELCHGLARSKLPPIVPGLSAQRQAGLVDTAALLSVLLREARPARLVFSSWGLREGVLMDSLGIDERMEDPLIAGITAFGRNNGVDPDLALCIADWTRQAAPANDPKDEALRYAAAVIGLAVQRIEPNLRRETATGWALRKRWIGTSAADRAMMAACLLGNAGQLPFPPLLVQLASEAALVEGRIWGLALRLARRFSGLAPEALAQSALRAEKGRLVLSVNPALAGLVSLAVERDLKILAQQLRLSPKIATKLKV